MNSLKQRLNPINQRRLGMFFSNPRAKWSLWIFLVLFTASLFSEFIANNKPVLVFYDGGIYSPILTSYSETTFGGDFETEADYSDEYVIELINEKGWAIWPPIPYSYDTHISGLEHPAPSPPTSKNWLGTDDQARDVVARVIYGFRISILFALTLTIGSCIVGVFVGAVQGYFGGKIDLVGQRFLEIWGGLPVLFLLIIMANIVTPSFWWLLAIMLLFNWTALVDVVRAEFLRGRNLDYVRAAKALGVPDNKIMARHILPNAMVATVTLVPFLLAGAVTTLTSLDFLGFGMPPGSPSLGELVAQGKGNLQAPWLALTAFTVLAALLTLLVFIGEGVRDAFDPRLVTR
ncbi:ABC transporter permease [Aestuariicella hydrocarbonica]|uniref:ABC transporter permease n=1 Tax=Pseudomaricurvus hydrocarbonicus TaxID=1470433 RepID=A0A9E5JVK6_9GAMM|nr:ABC transporter permease [Aestuariicella hydrocarbonica]NHO65366.1 ABC transporter permease [Aestuariicella hydrocarbonica]